VKPGKEGHLTVAFRFLSIHQSLCRPPRQRLATIILVLPAVGLKIAFRCGFIQVAKKQQKQ
jgi:hypothetical protein